MQAVLLLRAVNLGPRNKLAMKDLAALLDELGCTNVRTHLNSGNATFATSRRGTAALARDVETGLKRLGLDIRALVLTPAQVRRMLDELPEDLEGYLLVSALFDKAPVAAVRELEGWEPERVMGGPGCLYLGYDTVQGSKLTNAVIEKALGVATTSRTPKTLERLLEALA